MMSDYSTEAQWFISIEKPLFQLALGGYFRKKITRNPLMGGASRYNETKKRKILKFVQSNSFLKGDRLTVKWRQPLDLIPLMSGKRQGLFPVMKTALVQISSSKATLFETALDAKIVHSSISQIVTAPYWPKVHWPCEATVLTPLTKTK